MSLDDTASPRHTLCELARLLAASPGRFASEDELQEHLAAVLAPLGFAPEVEVAPGDQPDFFRETDGLIVEVKVDGSRAAVLRQIARYLAADRVSGLLLASTRPGHAAIPAALTGKPVEVAGLWCWGLCA